MDVLKKQTVYTISDIYALPDGERAELIDGQIYNMAPPGRLHQKISWKLHQAIANYIDSRNGLCEVYAAPFAVFLNDDDINYVEPDLSVIGDLSKLDYGFEKDMVEKYDFNETVPVGIFEGFTVKIE